MTLFIAMTILSLFFAYLAERNNSKIALFLCIASISLYAACRGQSVGIDTANYYRTFWNVFNGTRVTFKDWGYETIIKCLMNVFRNPAGVVFVFSCLTNILILSRLWKMREKSSFSFMVFIYIACYYAKSMNIIRQYLAIAIVFWAISFLEEKKYAKFIVAQVIASGIHISSLCGVPIFLVYLLKAFKEDKKNKNRIKILLILSSIACFVLIRYIDLDSYIHYFSSSSFSIGLITVYRLMLIVFIWFIARFSANRKEFSYDKSGALIPLDEMNLAMYAVGLALSSLGMFFEYMGRIGLMFVFFEMPTLGQIVQSKRYRMMMWILCCLPFVYLYIMLFIQDGNGIFPYVPFWNN